MIATTCFGPPRPSSGSLCRTLLNYNFVELVGKNTSLYVQQCCGKKVFRAVVYIECTLNGTQYTPQLETLFTTTPLNIYLCIFTD